MAITLNGIAQGYITDRVSALCASADLSTCSSTWVKSSHSDPNGMAQPGGSAL